MSFVCCFLHARSRSNLASPDPSPDAYSERHHKAYRHFSTVNDETERTWRRLIEEPTFFTPISATASCEALKSTDPKHSSGHGNLKSCLTDDFYFESPDEHQPYIWKAVCGKPSDLNNYQPTSKLSVLAEKSLSKTDFRSGHSIRTAAVWVKNDVIVVLEMRQVCAVC